MAAPTSPRVEATSITTTTVRWTYSGSSDMAVFRSTNGSSYSEITTSPNARVAVGTAYYLDSGLSTETKYWYKMSDDNGSTFSDVVTVWTHACAATVSEPAMTQLPPFAGDEEITAERINEMQTRIEEALHGATLETENCLACPEDGAVVIDCREGCNKWTVIADQDINSISINWCNRDDGYIDFLVPANTTRQICGFPSGFGFSGDECTQAPIIAGANGRTLRAGFAGGGTGGGRASAGSSGSTPDTSQGVGKGVGSGSGTLGGAGGGAGCTCVTTDGGLTIKSCNAGNSLDCHSTQKLRLLACGGRPPYTWSETGSLSLSSTTGNSTVVTPPTNAGSAEAGVAYVKNLNSADCGHSVGTIHSDSNLQAQYSCADAFTVCGAHAAPTTLNFCFSDPTCSCSVHSGHANNNFGTVSCTHLCPGVSCATAQSKGAVQDTRTGAMIAAGCVPCGLNEGATVTVTDVLGTQTTVVLRA